MNSGIARCSGGIGRCLAWLAIGALAGGAVWAQAGGAVLTGKVVDPTGLPIPGATVTVVNAGTGAARSVTTGRAGEYTLRDVEAGDYRLEAAYPGFALHVERIALDGGTKTLDLKLAIEPGRESVDVEALGAGYATLAGTQLAADDATRARSRNAAELLSGAPGVDLQTNGAIASIPFVHGLGDERTRLVVNGMTLSSACPNHMNPALTYIDPSNVASVTVTAGVTPVSEGGDSLGGTISVESAPPAFAKAGDPLHFDAVLSSAYDSNAPGWAEALKASVASRYLSFTYTGSWDKNNDYHDGSGQVVTSTYAQTTNDQVSLAALNGANLFQLDLGLHNTPYEGFPNQQMDLTANRATFVNGRYRRNLGRAVLHARLYWQDVHHEMNVGRDKLTFPMPMWMPMDTHGRDLGYSLALELTLAERHTLQVGNEFHRFALDDTWPAVPGAEPYMGPNQFVDINGGHRVQLGTFADLTSRWNDKVTTVLGIRNDTVWSNTGDVSGYSDMYQSDADAFNAEKHQRTDVNFDVTALARYEPAKAFSIEAGYSYKTRTPNLYERYAWSTNMMASGMINWFGDGNYYVGNADLKPEDAGTVSATLSIHDPAHQRWQLKATPYWTHIHDYIGVEQMMTTTYGESAFAQLQFANQKARTYGVDVSGDVELWDSAALGRAMFRAVAGWRRGTVLTTDENFYHILPLNARLILDETRKAWTAAAELELVDRKTRVDALRFEPVTPGYALVNLRTGYRWQRFGVEVGINNAFNRLYSLPLGGVNFDQYLASGWSGAIGPLAGAGRSFHAGLTIHL